MQRLEPQVKKRLITQIKQGECLGKLVNRFNLSKSTIFYYIKKIRGKKIKDIEVIGSDEQIGELIGIFSGDGNFHEGIDKRYRVSIACYVQEPEYVDRIEHIFKAVYRNCKVFRCNGASTINIMVQRKKVIEHLRRFLEWKEHKKTYTIHLLKNPTSHSHDFLRGFVRGLIDTDGTVDSYSRIAFSTVSERLASDMELSLRLLGFNPTRWLRKKNSQTPLFSVVIKKVEASNYLNQISFGNPYKQRRLMAEPL